MKFGLIIGFLLLILSGCDLKHSDYAPASASGVVKATTKVKPQSNGLTVEQNAVTERYNRDNKPGSIKHLYIISAYSGQVLIYSTVKGKVTSSGKRLTPNTVNGCTGSSSYCGGFPITIGGATEYTNEVLQDDGTYGSSIEYLYWFDSKDVYHQQYVTGGMILHISDQPVSVKGVVINMEIVGEHKEEPLPATP